MRVFYRQKNDFLLFLDVLQVVRITLIYRQTKIFTKQTFPAYRARTPM